MNCTSCNMPHAGHELVDGKCVRCHAKDNSDLRQRLAVFETPEYHRLKAACVEYEDSEAKCNFSGPIIWQSLQLRRFKAKASLEETAIAFARAQK